LPAILEARNKVLDDYNLMNKIASIASQKHDSTAYKKSTDYIYGRHIYRRKKPVAAFKDVIHRLSVNQRL